MSEHRRLSYLSGERGALPYCPGCGHDLLAKPLDQAFVKLQIDPRHVVVVTDIGCIGLTCKYFDTNAFHGLHGRSITYACGLKLARPELKVVALMGDGGCGIGGTHLLNVARRNIGITLLVANNFNYGMTGGQHSVTSPAGSITATTPWGHIEAPMDLCATAGAAGAAWVWRASAFDKDLPDTIARAIEQPGFAMVDIWELCTAYFMPRNDLRKKGLMQMLERFDLTLGQQIDRPRPEYSQRYREVTASARERKPSRRLIEASFSSELERQTGVLIAGSAGQKVKSASTAFAQGGMFAALQATQKDDYPITVKTGHSVAEVIFSPARIDYAGLEAADHLLLLSDHGVGRVRAKLAALPAESTVYADETLDLPAIRARVLRYPFIATAKRVGRLSLPFVGLGAVLAHTKLYPIAALVKAIEAFQRAEIAKVNRAALELGAALTPAAPGG